MLTVFSELLLSIIVLILMIWGLKRGGILKISIILINIVILASYGLKHELVFKTGAIVNGLLLINKWVWVSKVMLVISCVLLLLLFCYKKEEKENGDSWILLVLIVLLSSLLLVSSVNWVAIYLALELQTLTFFILVSKKIHSAYSTEAGLKYFVLGAISSGLFLFGCTLLYGISGETSIQGINSVLLGDAGKICITASLLFKLSVVPFHMWAPDVYEGVPTLILALLAIMPKIGVFVVLVLVGLISNVVLFCGVLSIIYGAIGALNQTKIKRLLAYSGIGHIGFMLFGVAIGSFESIQASLIYIVIYIIMGICVFLVILSLKLTRVLIIEINSLSRVNRVLALTLALTVISIAGIPPFAGFLGKWLILLSGMVSGYFLICLVIVVASVIGGVYYVRMAQIIYFPNYFSILSQKLINRVAVINLRKSVILGGASYLICFLMVAPNWVLQVTHDATIGIYI